MTKKEKKDDQAPGKDDKPKPADGDQKGKAGTTPKASGKAGTANEAAGKESTNLKPGSVGAGSESGGGGSRGVLAVVLVACAVGLAAAGGYFFMLHGQDRAAVGGAARQERDKTPFPCKERYADDEIRSFVDRHLAGAKGGHKEPQLLLMLGGSGAGKGTFIDKWKSAEQRGQASGHPLSGFLTVADSMAWTSTFRTYQSTRSQSTTRRSSTRTPQTRATSPRPFQRRSWLVTG
ncbi:unnamed protein product [Prorocentrum cordatum]|uniref:Zeta toxin domain-containing protein n=1 Tax=Prorocentrum cordatum TaxID=2364126 RepID=A0ABN9SJD2_9DINO|nr:unnamed protein product [Polarella glacialis]